MTWSVIPASDRAGWQVALSRFPAYDIYHLADYHRAHEGPDGARAFAYCAEVQGEHLFHAVLARPIDRVGREQPAMACQDTTTVYGYSGPLATTADPAFLAEAWRGYAEWCAGQRIVTEFIRFNPLLQNHSLAAPGTIVWRDRETVVVNLAQGEDAMWDSYAAVHRNSVRKAQKSGVTCAPCPLADGLPSFRAIYDETMRGLAVDAFYFFNDAYYDALVRDLGRQTNLFMARHQGKDIAGALFFAHGDTLHYHLAGSRSGYRELAPNNLLIDTAARWGIRQGLRRLHLGGGRTPAADDSLFRFKARFSPLRADFHCGKRVIDPAAYESLTGLWRSQRPAGASEPAYFQLYRLDPAN